MRKIKAVTEGEQLSPAEPIPSTALKVVCDGEFYHVAESEEDLLDPVFSFHKLTA